MPRERAYLEWEVLSEAESLTHFEDLGPLDPGTHEIRIERDQEYCLSARATGIPERRFDERERGEPGTWATPSEIRAVDPHVSAIVLGGVHSGSGSHSHSYSGPRPESRFEQDVLLASFHRKRTSERPRSVLACWYINGPKEDVFLMRNTDRTTTTRFRREREETALPEPDHDEDPKSLTSDYAIIETPNLKFLVAHVPKEYAPDWTHPFSVEYREAWGIPEESTITGVAEALSFVFGRHLLHVGWTSFDANWYPIEEHAISPWGRSPRATCESGGEPPVHIGWRDFEAIAAPLVNAYLGRRTDLNLDMVLWQLWIAREAPIAIDLPIYHASLSTLVESWYATRPPESGVYMEREEFNRVLRPEFESAETRLRGRAYADRMIRRMRDAYRMGANERIPNFFQAIGVPLGDAELRALRARNKPAHGLSRLSAADTRRFIRHQRAYQVMIVRALLTLLNYPGPYVDYTSIGFPSRAITTPAAAEGVAEVDAAADARDDDR